MLRSKAMNVGWPSSSSFARIKFIRRGRSVGWHNGEASIATVMSETIRRSWSQLRCTAAATSAHAWSLLSQRDTVALCHALHTSSAARTLLPRALGSRNSTLAVVKSSDSMASCTRPQGRHHQHPPQCMQSRVGQDTNLQN